MAKSVVSWTLQLTTGLELQITVSICHLHILQRAAYDQSDESANQRKVLFSYSTYKALKVLDEDTLGQELIQIRKLASLQSMYIEKQVKNP